ncbi:MAG: alanine racemase [Mariprofundaceae bacterium]|nr:alanine racemase [Mariprofundaceae bacterium]
MSRPAIAYIHLEHLRHNYRLLVEHADQASIMAVIKANAYGHSLHLIAPALLGEGCRSFAVTDANEGACLRKIIGSCGDIVLLSGLFDMEDAQLCHNMALTPALTEPAQLAWLKATGFTGSAWLKVDTGMGRLGSEHINELYQNCEDSGIGIAGLMSHLACADEPDHPLNEQQLTHFKQIADTLPAGTRLSLLNSAGLVSMPASSFDVVRPGIALYGAEPVSNQPLGLQPVMQLSGSVMQIRDVKRGATISYGATFTAPGDMRIATVSLGYADGLPRGLSKLGQAAADLGRDKNKTAILPIVGRICMDYCMLDVTQADLAPGDEVEFWGERLSASNIAGQLGTIPYELFTGVGGRVIRKAIQ